MASKYADGLTHGHCRYGACSVVAVPGRSGWPWSDRLTGDDECDAAPRRPCETCSGAGVVPCAGCALGERCPGAHRCDWCAGLGDVAGPHWPYRFPEP
jgi:hypothetical protein